MKSRLLEFDARLDAREYVSTLWTREMREQYLIRPDIEWPLSVDRYVWPSVFLRLGEDVRRDIDYFPVMVDDSGERQYWQDMSLTRQAYLGYTGTKSPAILIAIELFHEHEIIDNRISYHDCASSRMALEAFPTSPAYAPSSADILGFDVATAGRLSGLSDCGYDSNEILCWRSEWEQRLNTYGLLRTIEDANEFRERTDMRTPEHAPFWIYRLLRIADLSLQDGVEELDSSALTRS